MPTRCETCGSSEPPAALVALQGLDEGHQGEGHAIQLCQRCLSAREARAWPAKSDDGQRLLDALADHRLPAKGRFMYLKEGDEHIHLLRMRHDWFDRHTAIPA